MMRFVVWRNKKNHQQQQQQQQTQTYVLKQ